MKKISKLISSLLAISISTWSVANLNCHAYMDECPTCIFYSESDVSVCPDAIQSISINKQYKFYNKDWYKHPNYNTYRMSSYDDYDYFSYKVYKFSLPEDRVVMLNVKTDIGYIYANISPADGTFDPITKTARYIDDYRESSDMGKKNKYIYSERKIGNMTPVNQSNRAYFCQSWNNQFKPEAGYITVDGADYYHLEKGDYVVVFRSEDNKYKDESLSVTFSIATLVPSKKLSKPEGIKAKYEIKSNHIQLNWKKVANASGYALYIYDNEKKYYCQEGFYHTTRAWPQAEYRTNKFKLVAVDKWGNMGEPVYFTVKVNT